MQKIKKFPIAHIRLMSSFVHGRSFAENIYAAEIEHLSRKQDLLLSFALEKFDLETKYEVRKHAYLKEKHDIILKVFEEKHSLTGMSLKASDDASGNTLCDLGIANDRWTAGITFDDNTTSKLADSTNLASIRYKFTEENVFYYTPDRAKEIVFHILKHCNENSPKLSDIVGYIPNYYYNASDAANLNAAGMEIALLTALKHLIDNKKFYTVDGVLRIILFYPKVVQSLYDDISMQGCKSTIYTILDKLLIRNNDTDKRTKCYHLLVYRLITTFAKHSDVSKKNMIEMGFVNKLKAHQNSPLDPSNFSSYDFELDIAHCEKWCCNALYSLEVDV